MSSDESDIWYRLGFALERARSAPSRLPALETLLSGRGASRSGDRGGNPDSGDSASGSANPGDGAADPIRSLLATGAGSLGTRLVRRWGPRRRVSVLSLGAAGASGAVAATLAELLSPLIRSRGLASPLEEADLGPALLEGIGKGLVYGGVVEPRMPGPAYLLGFVYGTAEYLTASWGGLPSLLRSVSPHRRVPLVSELLEPSEEPDADYVESVIFGLALALLYDAVHEKRGIADEE